MSKMTLNLQTTKKHVEKNVLTTYLVFNKTTQFQRKNKRCVLIMSSGCKWQ